MFRDTAPLPLSRLPELLERLYDSLAAFLDAKLALFRKEVWEEGESLIRRALGVAVSLVVAIVGFSVVTAGLVLALDAGVRNLPLSCFIVGGAYFALGAGVAATLAKNLKRRPLEKSRVELEEDKQWIKAQASDI